MKIGGVEVTKPSEELMVFPRDGGDLVFRAQAIEDMDVFEKLCPEPIAPGVRTKDGFVKNEKDPAYQEMVEHRQNQQLAFIVIKTLKPSAIEWQEVSEDNPSTWLKWRDELHAAGMTSIETNRLVNLVLEANCITEKRMKEAREHFVRGLQQA